MVHDIASLVHYASRWMTLEEGDIILTGTPAGVGPVALKNTRQASSYSIIVKLLMETSRH